MRKDEVFRDVMEVVARVTGLSERELLESRTEEATDGRYLVVRALAKLGFTDSDSASVLGCTRQAVGYLRNRYKKAGKWLLENEWKSLRKWLENEYLEGK